MIETLMALWNQDRRKRAKQVFLTFLLMCIGISLLFIITNNSIQAQYRAKQTALKQPTSTVPSFGNTVVPDLTPTTTVIIGIQPSAATTKTHPIPAVTPTTPVVLTPTATITQPCPATPASAYNQETTGISQQGVSTASYYSGKGVDSPFNYKDGGGGGGGGGGPIGTPTMITPLPTVVPSATPSNHPPGWIPSCTNSNSIAFISSNNAFSVLVQNAWTILGSAFFGTIMFYALVFAIKRRSHEH